MSRCLVGIVLNPNVDGMLSQKLSLLITFSAFTGSISHALINAPSEVTATAAGPATIAISWTDNASDEDNYIVQRNDGSWTTIATLDANSTYYYDRGLSLGLTHEYRIQATNTSEVSAAVESGSASTLSYQPNIIFFLADDMGYKDIVALRDEAIDGPTIYETPALDSFIGSYALNVNNAYCSGPKCVVARRSIQTGKYDWRPEAVPNNDYYVDHNGAPIGGGLWAGGTTVAGSESGAGVVIPSDNETYGEALKAAGYRTCFIGKYHLGESSTADTPTGYSFGDQPGRGPIHQGYDVSIAAGHAGAPPASYFAVENLNDAGNYTFELPDLDGATYGASAPVAGEYINDRMTVKALGFIDDAITNYSSQPFHMTFAHYAVHTPAEAQSNASAPDGKGYEYFQAKKAAMASDFANHPAGPAGLVTDSGSMNRTHQSNAVYAAMMKSYDASFEALWNYLQATDDPRNPGKKLSETTVIVISSDHGGKSTTSIDNNKSLEDDSVDEVNPAPVPLTTNYRSSFGNTYSFYPTSNYPYRQGKTWSYEGGLKVPLVIYIPGITTGNTETDAFVHHADLFSTFVDMAGGTQSSESTDSVSFMLSAAQPEVTARDEMHHFFTNANEGTANPAIGAYRKGDYKMLYFMIQRRVELYNLVADPYERDDLSTSRPELAAEMLHELYQQVLSTGNSMPKPGSNSWNQEQAVFLNNGLIGSLPAIPDANPTWVGVGATQTSTTTIELNWQVNASNATHSVVHRRSDPDGETNFREVAYLPAGVTTYVDRDLVAGGTYRYRIESENFGGWATGNTGNKTLTLSNPGPGNLAIDAVDDGVTTVPGELRCFNPLLNDAGEGALLITAITQPTQGTASIDGQWIRYQAPEGFSGSATMTYTIEDAASQSDTATVTFSLPVSPSSESALEAWEFDDTVGTDLNDLNNSGSLNSLWRFNTTAATDGSGNFVVPGDAGTTTRRLPERGTANALAGDDFYATPFTSGKYRFEVKFASWDVDAASAGDSLTFQVNDVSSATIARIDFELNAADVDIRFSGFDGNFRVTDPLNLVEASATTAAIEFDFDNDTIDYLLNGSVIYSFAFTGSNIGRMSYVQTGVWSTAATSISLDHLKLIEFIPGGTLYDAYASTYPWMGILNRGVDEDPDFDGMNNFLEFALGMNPTQAEPSPVVLDNSGVTPKLQFTPVRDTSLVDYTVQFSNDLNDWSTIPEVVVTSDAGVLVEETLPVGGLGFGRVSVSE